MTSQVEKKSSNGMRRATRLAAVQALYQIALSPEPASAIMCRFCEDPGALLQEESAKADVDVAMFGAIVSGVSEGMQELDAMLAQAVDARLSADRMEPLLKAILRLGVFELWRCPDVSSKIIINDYVDVTHSFFDAKEPGLVNAVLDNLAKKLRA